MGGLNEKRANIDASSMIFVDTTSAILSALSVAPAISIVDKAIVSNASGLETLFSSIKTSISHLIRHPYLFVKQRSFLLIWGVYSGTYIAANNIQGYCERERRSAVYPKLIGSSTVNVTLSVMKDKVFAKLFAAQGVPVPAPMSVKSLGLFAVRDSMTIFASFTLPPIVSEKLQSFGVPQGTADVSSQLFSPCAMQFISTPLHLIGLDLYNNPNTSNASRISFVTQEYLKTAFARIGRILPAFGIGGVLNKELREKGAKYYKSFEMPKMDEMITKCDASEKDLKGR